MAFQLSPGINVTEVDLTTIVPSVATSIGGIAAPFAWGPVGEIVTISDEVRLADRFGKPSTDNYEYWFTAANFLSYTNNLKVVRTANARTKTATTGYGLNDLDITIVDSGAGNATHSGIITVTVSDYGTNSGLVSANATVTVTLDANNKIKTAVVTTPGLFLSGAETVGVVSANATHTSSNITFSLAGSAALIKNDSDWESNWAGGANTYGTFAARYAGALGNSLKVSMADANTFTGWTYASNFPSAPGTSTHASNKGASNDELHLIVIDEDGKFTGTRGTVLETLGYMSKASDAKDTSGNNIYYKDVIARKSKYINWLSHPTASGNGNTAWGSTATNNTFKELSAAYTISLVGGVDGTMTNGDIIGTAGTGYSAFDNKEDVDVSFILAGPSNETVIEALISTAETRKDVVVFVSPEKADVVDNAGSEATDSVAFRNTLTSSNYVFMDGNWKYQYDKYNDVYRWVPMNGDIAGLCGRTDMERDPWYSPGGLNRGIIKNVIKTAWNPNKTDRDTLYVNNINPVVTFRGEGTVLFGDKTMTSKPSAFDRINVRRLFIVLEKAIERATRYSLFEFNDQFTRAQFVAMVEPFLRDVQGRRGITDFRVVCDDTNNTGEVIDRNEFIGDIFIKPARSINFIQLNFIAVRTGVSFNEVVGKLY